MREQIAAMLENDFGMFVDFGFLETADAILALINSPENVERVARALQGPLHGEWTEYEGDARAALKALMEGEDGK